MKNKLKRKFKKNLGIAAMTMAIIPSVMAPSTVEASEMRGLHAGYNIRATVNGKKNNNVFTNRIIRLVDTKNENKYYTRQSLTKIWVPSNSTYKIYDLTGSGNGSEVHKNLKPIGQITVYSNGGTTVANLKYNTVEFFEDINSEKLVQSETIISGNKVKEPTVPSGGNKIFNGWVDAQGNKFNFNNPINKETKVYATWSQYLSDIDFSSGTAYYESKNGTGIGVEGVITNASFDLSVDGQTKTFAKSIATHAPANVTYDLKGKNIDSFTTSVSVDPSRPFGKVEFKVLVDGIEVKSVLKNKGEDATSITIENLRNANKLELVAIGKTDNSSNPNTHAMGIWGDPQFH